MSQMQFKIMNTFLNQPEATFYHITTLEKWNTLKENGWDPSKKKIFVSRVGEIPILLSIALEQLPEIYESKGIVFLKLPQSKNNFVEANIKPDNQARVEWTKGFQNVILNPTIPPENFEIMCTIKFHENEFEREKQMTFLNSIAQSGRENYNNHFITARAEELNY